MKTTFDLPDALVRKAKALAARQGRPLRDVVAEAIDQKLLVEPSELTDRREEHESRQRSWEAWKARLIRDPDGTWRNPDGVEDEPFFESLEDVRREAWATRDPFCGDAG